MRRLLRYALGTALALAFILAAIGIDAMTSRWVLQLVVLSLALAGAFVLVGPEDGAK